MRELVLDAIEGIRTGFGGEFDKNTMLWSSWWIIPHEGHDLFYSKKEQKQTAPNAIRLCDTTRADFETLSDVNLLVCYTMLVRYTSKQM